jgi:hypothetical protein
MILVDFSSAQATDEHRRAYDQMVEDSVKEADEYIQQKQSEHAQRHAERIEAEQRRAEEETEMQEDEEGDGYSRGIIVVAPPAGRPPGIRPPGKPPGHRPPGRPPGGKPKPPKPTPLPSRE